MFDESIAVLSPLSHETTHDGRVLKIEIYKLEGFEEWTLEVVDEYRNSTTWAETFTTDLEALREIRRVIRDGGFTSLLGPEGGEDWPD